MNGNGLSMFASRLRTAFHIHAGEGRMAVLVIGVMLFKSAGFTLGSKGVETLFYTRYGVQYLPQMFLLSGVVSIFVFLGMTAVLGPIRRETLYVWVPIGVVCLTLVAWMALFSTWNGVYPILWLGKEIINSLVTLVVWGVAGTVCDTRQSKRLYPLFNAGSILGAVIGGFGTGILVDRIGTQNLMLVWAFILGLAFVLTRMLMRGRIPAGQLRPIRRKKRRSSPIHDMQQGFQFVRGSSLMAWVSLSVVLFSVLYRCIELPFARAATTQYLGDDRALAGFLGLFEGLSTAAAFLVSTLLANRIFARFGIMNALLAFPVIYLIGFGTITLLNGFALIIAFRFVQMLWLSGAADSAYQAMFNAVPSARREQVRAFMNLPEQAGTILAGLVSILFTFHQLSVVGLVSAVAATLIIRRAGGAYNFALFDSLRKGLPTLFNAQQRPDAPALAAAADGMKNPDVLVRRISTEIIGRHASEAGLLVSAIFDEDDQVRISALRGLVRLQASPALLDIASLLSDPQPALRAEAVDALRALTPFPRGLSVLLNPLLEDPDARVRVRAMVALLSADPHHPARIRLRQMSMLGEEDERILALHAFAEISDPEALMLFSNELQDRLAPVPIRCAAASALGTCGAQAIPPLIDALSCEQASIKASAAKALGKIGDESLSSVVTAVAKHDSEEGALLALNHLPAWKAADPVREYIKMRVDSSVRFEGLRLAIHPNANERVRLLADSLHNRALRDGIFALTAAGLLTDRETISVAVKNLKSRNQVSDALEMLETVKYAALLRPLSRIWEPGQGAPPALSLELVAAELKGEKDEWLRACAQFAMEEPMETMTALSNMERILLLRRVPLLADLSPAELQSVAAIAMEQVFHDGEAICEQGETGDEMFVIVSGEARIVVRGSDGREKEIARRAAGEVVGEMSLISGGTRMASVIASGDVRTLCLDRPHFESLLRERPEVSLAVMRELCKRLMEK